MRFGKKQVAVQDNLSTLEKVIIDIVNQKQGCKLMELIVDIANIIANENRSSIDFTEYDKFKEILEFNVMTTDEKVTILLDTITGLISNNKLIGLHYRIGSGSGNYHEKMFILPKGSGFKYLNKKEGVSNE